METNSNWRLTLMNELMELVFMTGSSMDLSHGQAARLKDLFNALTPAGKEQIEIWAEDNNRSIPNYCYDA